MGGEWLSVRELQDAGVLLVEDGNHGESRPRSDEFSESGVAFIRAANLIDGTVDFAGAERINDVARARITKGIGKPSDILLSHKGTVGKLARVEADAPPFVCSPQTTFWRAINPNRLRVEYLYAFMQSAMFLDQLASVQGETDMAPYVSLTAQRRLRVPVPSLVEQKLIGNLLSALDDKIALNRRMAGTLEGVARALFQGWFVDFEPVHAKAEGRDSGLPAPLAARFPSRLTPEGVPEGWAFRPLSSLAEFLNGLALQKYPATPDEPSLPVIKIVELRAGPTSKSARASTDVPEQYIVQNGDHLFSWSGSLVHTRWSHGPGALNQHLFKVTPKGVPAWLTYEAVEHHLAGFQAIASGKAVTMGHIQRHHLDEATLAIPPFPLLDAMNPAMSSLHDRAFALALENQTLASLRDTLLPKLISGELRIADSERAVVAA